MSFTKVESARIGDSVHRIEDQRLLTGKGSYTDDRRLSNAAHMVLVRSPHAHAAIGGIDLADALAMPGVLAILTAEDVERDGLGTFSIPIRRKDGKGKPNFEPIYRVLAKGTVNHVGDPVAAVFAETLAEALDAADAVMVDYDMLPSVTDCREALQEGAAAVWPEVPDNLCFLHDAGDRTATETALAACEHVTRVEMVVTRVAPAAMEPRGYIGIWDARDQRYILEGGMQSVHNVRAELAKAIFKVPEHMIRVISPDMGGGFGMKGAAYPEQALVLWGARKLDRPVRWIATRSESFVSDYAGRDMVAKAALGLDKDGTLRALQVEFTANLGAYICNSGMLPSVANLGGLSGVYRPMAISARVLGVFTNTNPVAPYRGAGRPEATFVIERMIDAAAAELGLDRLEIRRRNAIPSEAMPHRTGFLFTYDSGDFLGNMARAVTASDWTGYAARKAASEAKGKLRGISLINAIEVAGGPFPTPMDEGAEIRFNPDGSATLFVGGHNHGQGHETVYRQIMHDKLGLTFDQIQIVEGDTDKVFHGRGTYGSRSMSAGGTAMIRASEKIIAKAKQIAAHRLETAEVDIEFGSGHFTVAGTDRSISLTEVARAAWQPQLLPPGMELGLDEKAIAAPENATFPNGTNVCEVEIDPETGVVTFERYTVVDDVGTVLNPLLVKGQIHGGVVQGLGQIILEDMTYDEGGQLLAGSFMDYAMPRASDLCAFEVLTNSQPTATNPLGVKGAGEAGAVGALPAGVNAIIDALRPLGIQNFDMPATPHRVWQAIQAAKSQGANP